MKFIYKLYDIGWADAQLEINDKTEYFSVSYLTDALRDLLEGIISLLPECTPNDELKKSVKVEWWAEPGGSVWNIEEESKELIHIKIESYEDLDLMTGRTVTLDEYCNKNDFILCIVDEMSNILWTHGFVGYKETWYEHDFPISAYLKLRHYINSGHCYPLEHIERHPGNEYSRSKLADELAVLRIGEKNVG